MCYWKQNDIWHIFDKSLHLKTDWTWISNVAWIANSNNKDYNNNNNNKKIKKLIKINLAS